MNFLQLAQRVREESGLQGSGPSAVTGQSGESLKVVNWTRNAWREIQLSRTAWRWMRASASCQTSIGVGDYAPVSAFGLSRFGRWLINTFRCYETALGTSDEGWLHFMPYDDFRDRYRFGSQQSGRPIHFAIGPNDSVLLGPKPDRVYTLTADYFKSAQELAANSDTPECPADYHMAIVWRALMRYGAYDAAPEVYDDAKNNFEMEMHRLERDQLDTVTIPAQTLVE